MGIWREKCVFSKQKQEECSRKKHGVGQRRERNRMAEVCVKTGLTGRKTQCLSGRTLVAKTAVAVYNC